MHAALLSILVISGADRPAQAFVGRPPVRSAAMVSSSGCSRCGGAGCANCSSGAAGSNGAGGSYGDAGGYGADGSHVAADGYDSYNGQTWCQDWWDPMPQTCYNPTFGCYAGAGRTMHRYPAFHGYYYRSPYNYRHDFEYPWHALPHHPEDFYIYRQEREDYRQDKRGPEIVPTPQAEPWPLSPALMPASPEPMAQRSQLRQNVYAPAVSGQWVPLDVAQERWRMQQMVPAAPQPMVPRSQSQRNAYAPPAGMQWVPRDVAQEQWRMQQMVPAAPQPMVQRSQPRHSAYAPPAGMQWVPRDVAQEQWRMNQSR